MCDIYWPEEEKELTYDYLKIKMTKRHKTNDFYWYREFDVTNIQTKETRTVGHYHSVGWPDRKVPKPEYEVYFAELFEKISNIKDSQENIPIIVHCSAGVGRTGTTIALYFLVNLLKLYENEFGINLEKAPGLSIFGTVRCLREHRNFMVQTNDQYQYIYQFMHKKIQSMFK